MLLAQKAQEHSKSNDRHLEGRDECALLPARE
jgi:hypothetical protein